MTFTKMYPLKSAVLAIIAFIACSFSGCDHDDITFGTSLEGTIAVNETEEGQQVTYTKTILLDATSDAQVEKYRNKIQNFTINSISYVVEDYEGPDVCTFSGTLSLSQKDAATPGLSFSIENLNVHQLSQLGTAITIPVDKSVLTTISQWLADDKALELSLDGTLSETPVQFNIQVALDVRVQASAL